MTHTPTRWLLIGLGVLGALLFVRNVVWPFVVVSLFLANQPSPRAEVAHVTSWISATRIERDLERFADAALAAPAQHFESKKPYRSYGVPIETFPSKFHIPGDRSYGAPTHVWVHREAGVVDLVWPRFGSDALMIRIFSTPQETEPSGVAVRRITNRVFVRWD